jgi:hypothetical protein
MKNITTAISNGKGKTQILTITIDLSKTFGRSKSGKTTIIASTEGNVAVEGTEVILGLNAYIKD